MNIYRYKNNIRFNVFNCTQSEVDGHIRVLMNVATLEMRIWKFGTWGGLTYWKDVPVTEIVEFSDDTKAFILKDVRSRLMLNAGDARPNGAWELNTYLARDLDSRNYYKTATIPNWEWHKSSQYVVDILFFIFDNYLGDIEAPKYDMSQSYKTFHQYCMENLNPAIIKGE